MIGFAHFVQECLRDGAIGADIQTGENDRPTCADNDLGGMGIMIEIGFSCRGDVTRAVNRAAHDDHLFNQFSDLRFQKICHSDIGQRTNGNKSDLVRMRKNTLYTFGGTRLPYICLSPSPKDEGDILIRRGEVAADRPSIVLPGKDHALEGFDLGEGEDDEVVRILLARQINIPPAKYVNTSEGTTTERSTLDAGVEAGILNLR